MKSADLAKKGAEHSRNIRTSSDGSSSRRDGQALPEIGGVNGDPTSIASLLPAWAHAEECLRVAPSGSFGLEAEVSPPTRSAERCPCRMDFSQAECLLTSSTAKSTSAGLLHSFWIMKSLAALGISPIGSNVGNAAQRPPSRLHFLRINAKRR